jgi:preprotein translocase subunit SecD
MTFFNLKLIDMKTIKNIVVTLFILATLTVSLTGNGREKHIVLIRSAEADISYAAIDESAKIISSRLRDFDAGEFEVSVIPAKKQIKLTFMEDIDLQTIEMLITHNGIIEFWETYDRDELSGIMEGNDSLFSLMIAGDEYYRGAQAGCVAVEDIGRVNDYLWTLETDKPCKFAWSLDHEGSRACLFALKATDSAGPVITGSEVESAVFDKDIIKIRLTDTASVRFADATRRNLDRVIAMLLDDEVISFPRVRSEIPSGEIEISGRFTKSEAGYIAALLNNGVLPSGFYVVK